MIRGTGQSSPGSRTRGMLARPEGRIVLGEVEIRGQTEAGARLRRPLHSRSLDFFSRATGAPEGLSRIMTGEKHILGI